jgi:hypothetical protein
MDLLFTNTIYPMLSVLFIWVVAELIRLQIVKNKLKNTYKK